MHHKARQERLCARWFSRSTRPFISLSPLSTLFAPTLPLKLTTYKLTILLDQSNSSLQYFKIHPHPPIIHHQGFSHLSLSSAANVHLWLWASEIQFITVITITFWKEETGFYHPNIPLLIKINNEEAAFAICRCDDGRSSQLKLKHSWQSLHCFATECWQTSSFSTDYIFHQQSPNSLKTLYLSLRTQSHWAPLSIKMRKNASLLPCISLEVRFSLPPLIKG